MEAPRYPNHHSTRPRPPRRRPVTTEERSARTTFPDLQSFRAARLRGWRRVFAHTADVFWARGIARAETVRAEPLHFARAAAPPAAPRPTAASEGALRSLQMGEAAVIFFSAACPGRWRRLLYQRGAL
jgi:hypothetical protein